jgi:hypothetical protein
MKIYRCGYCGNMTDKDGMPFTKEEFDHFTNVIHFTNDFMHLPFD